MASECVVSLFEEARERVRGEIASIVESLNGKREGLLAEIGTLEREFLDMQRQRQKDINKLNALIAHTEELGQNTLLSLQQRMIQDMRQEMDKLKLDNKQEPDYRIDIKWGFIKAVLIQSINSSKLELITDTSADCSQESDATDSSEDDNSTEQVPLPCPSPVSDDWNSPDPEPVPQVIHHRTQYPEHRRRYNRDPGDRDERRPQSSDRAARGGLRDRDIEQVLPIGFPERVSRDRDFGHMGYQGAGPGERPFRGGEGGFRSNNRGTRPPRRPRNRGQKRGGSFGDISFQGGGSFGDRPFQGGEFVDCSRQERGFGDRSYQERGVFKPPFLIGADGDRSYQSRSFGDRSFQVGGFGQGGYEERGLKTGPIKTGDLEWRNIKKGGSEEEREASGPIIRGQGPSYPQIQGTQTGINKQPAGH